MRHAATAGEPAAMCQMLGARFGAHSRNVMIVICSHRIGPDTKSKALQKRRQDVLNSVLRLLWYTQIRVRSWTTERW